MKRALLILPLLLLCACHPSNAGRFHIVKLENGALLRIDSKTGKTWFWLGPQIGWSPVPDDLASSPKPGAAPDFSAQAVEVPTN